jgi:hypothetical protein
MVFLCRVVFGFITKPPTMIRLFAELSGRYPRTKNRAVNPWLAPVGLTFPISFQAVTSAGSIQLNHE